jgi:hypothetical protein
VDILTFLTNTTVLRDGFFGGLVLLAIVSVFRGWLVTRREADSYRTDRDAWKTAYEKERDARKEQGDQLVELLETAKATEQLLNAIPRIGGAM